MFTLESRKENRLLPSCKFYKRSVKKSDKSHESDFIKRIEALCHEFEVNPLPEDFRPKLDGPTVIWKVFKKQQQAIEFSCRYNDAMVFAFEERVPDNNGRRLFLVTNPRHMWRIHRNRPLLHRCSYEVIKEGSPCKLYFDLEFDKTCNKEKDGVEMIHIFIKCVCIKLKEMYNILCDATQVLWLDSSSEGKFSSHLIFQIGKAAFKNNIEVGNFVKIVCSSIEKILTTNATEIQRENCLHSEWPAIEELRKLIVKNKDEKKTLFCDLGVYSKNRNFRLFLSTKYGKKSPLIISEKNEYYSHSEVNDWEEAVFLDSLVSYLKWKDVRILTCIVQDADLSHHSKINEHGSFHSPQCELQGLHSSPYPEVDKFIEDIITRTKKPGFIRKWSYFSKEELLVYDIGNYRYCQNVGRFHKSNNIIFVVDLKKGVFYQKCYDPDCRTQSFKSQAQDLPREVLPVHFFQDLLGDFITWNPENSFLSEDEEASMVEAVTEVEKSVTGNSESMFINEDEEEKMVEAVVNMETYLTWSSENNFVSEEEEASMIEAVMKMETVTNNSENNSISEEEEANMVDAVVKIENIITENLENFVFDDEEISMVEAVSMVENSIYV